MARRRQASPKSASIHYALTLFAPRREWSQQLFWFCAIADGAGPPGLYERAAARTPGRGRDHAKCSARAAPSGKTTGAALGLVARDSDSGSLEFIYSLQDFFCNQYFCSNRDFNAPICRAWRLRLRIWAASFSGPFSARYRRIS